MKNVILYVLSFWCFTRSLQSYARLWTLCRWVRDGSKSSCHFRRSRRTLSTWNLLARAKTVNANKRYTDLFELFYEKSEKKKIGYSFLFKAILFTQSIAVVFQTNVSWNKSDTNVPSNSTETISVQNDNVRRGGMETEICVSIKDATFAWPNSKTPVLVVDDLKIEEGVLFNFFLPQITRLYNLNVSTTGVQLKTKQ